jgi:Flp pilus assembly protein TadG
MILRKMKSGRKQPLGQSLVELAFTLPIFLLLLIGIMEVGRLVFFYNAIYSASREGARYAAATDPASGTARYNNCAGIRSAAKKAGILAKLTDANIQIQYDTGPGTAIKSACPVDLINNDLGLGDRVVVTVTGTYHPLVPITNFGVTPITSKTARTLIKDLDINLDGTF